MARLPLLLAAGILLTGCEEDMGQDDWLVVENTTDERIFVMERGITEPSLLVVGLEPGENGRASLDPCDTTELVAHSGSVTGPVVATRGGAEYRDSVESWVIGPDDQPPTPYWTSSR